MNEDPKRVAYLIAGFIRGTLSDAERGELDEWITQSNENVELFGELTDEKNIRENLRRIESVNTPQSWEQMRERLGLANHPPKRFLRAWWLAAACVLLVLLTFTGYKFFKRDGPPQGMETKLVQNDVPPGGDRARLTLSDGSVIDLGTTKNGWISSAQGTEVLKQREGLLTYVAGVDTAVAHPVFHILTTPRGGQYRLVLPDSSKVWLNAASSLRYPIHFSNSRREVQLTGEAFFEVSKDPARPFVVEMPGRHLIEVTGTQFNAMTYPEEGRQEVTLVKGSVRVSAGGSTLRLEPGMKATISGETIQPVTQAAVEDLIAWKDNRFKFTDATIEEIMRQVERWYDVEVVYQDKPAFHFFAAVSRNTPVSTLLSYLELTKSVHFKIENKRITVMN